MAQDLLQIAIEDHRAGRLVKAEAGYLTTLAADPENADAYHWLGVLRFQAKQFTEAVRLFQEAIARRPDDTAFHHNMGQACLGARRKDDAIQAFTRAAALDPNAPDVLISLGMACLSRGLPGDPPAAIAAFRAALATGLDSADIYHRLGLAFMAGRRHSEAIAAFKQAWARKENDATILYHLALAHRATAELKETRKFLIKALEIDPTYGQAWCALGMLDSEAGKHHEAAGLFRRAISANREDIQAYRGLGHALRAVGKTLEGDLAMVKVEQLEAGLIARASAVDQRTENSKVADLEDHLTPTLAQSQIHFGMAAVMSVFPPDKLPESSVTGLFDKYAPSFDQHLRKLGYFVPEKIVEALSDVWDGTPLDILDLGCGTGLCGTLLRPMAKFLAGVDLSAGMIEKARESGTYDLLEIGDIVEKMRLRPKAYDLLVTTDVLIYIGDLSPTFEAAAASLRPGGVFAYSVEAGTGNRYTLQKRSHRFAHSKPYLQHLASIYGFEELKFLDIELRREASLPLMGFLVVLRAGQ